MIKSVWKCMKSIAISPKTCMEQAEIIDTFGTYQQAAPPGRLGPLELVSGSTSAPNFPNFTKTPNTGLLWMFTKFSYRITYLFLFYSCWRLNLGCNMFFMSGCAYCIHI